MRLHESTRLWVVLTQQVLSIPPQDHLVWFYPESCCGTIHHVLCSPHLHQIKCPGRSRAGLKAQAKRGFSKEPENARTWALPGNGLTFKSSFQGIVQFCLLDFSEHSSYWKIIPQLLRIWANEWPWLSQENIIQVQEKCISVCLVWFITKRATYARKIYF